MGICEMYLKKSFAAIGKGKVNGAQVSAEAVLVTVEIVAKVDSSSSNRASRCLYLLLTTKFISIH